LPVRAAMATWAFWLGVNVLRIGGYYTTNLYLNGLYGFARPLYSGVLIQKFSNIQAYCKTMNK